MTVKVVNGNLLEAKGGAVLLTVDGTARGMEGNLVRAFSKVYPDAWEDLEGRIKYPIGLGSARIFAIEPDFGCKFSHCLIASTLHHIEVLDDAKKLGIIDSALRNCMNIAANGGLAAVHTAVLVGGWRLELEQAFDAMLKSYRKTKPTLKVLPELVVHVLNHSDFVRIRECLKSRGVSFSEGKNGIFIP